jgi:hypothetical protein
MNDKRIKALVAFAMCAAVIIASCLVVASATTATTCYKPGATITVQYFFTVPANFHLGEDPLAGATFDKEKLKKLPVTISPLTYEWKRSALGVKSTESGGEKTTIAAKVKIKLKSNCPVGELSIPLKLEVLYCNVKEGWCTSSTYDDKPIKITVSKAKGSLSSGKKNITITVDPNA